MTQEADGQGIERMPPQAIEMEQAVLETNQNSLGREFNEAVI